MPQKLPDWFVKKAQAVTAKRAKTVIDHILKHGHITTEELKSTYGYDHPPRAARDVREQGVPLETFRIHDSQGKSIAAYRFGEPSEIRAGILGGRKVLSKKLKQLLIDQSSCRCDICLTPYQSRYLQVDHKVPYEVAGERGGAEAPNEFQLTCGSCNRAKSWSCEHCTNWMEKRVVRVCQTCYWASPESYTHVAMVPMRRIDIGWTGKQTRDYDKLAIMAQHAGESLQDFIKGILRDRL